MRYEMKNFIKMSKKPSNIGQSDKPKRDDDWKRERKIARKTKLNLRKSVA